MASIIKYANVLTAPEAVEIGPGNGMDFSIITGSGVITLGTPGTITGTSINEVTATSHTHAITGLQGAALTYTSATPSTSGTVDATTPAVNFTSTDVFTLTMPDGDRTMTFSNPRTNMNAVIKVVHPNSGTRVLTFPSAYWVGQTGVSVKAYSLTAGAHSSNTTRKYTHFYVTYDGSDYYLSDVAYWAS